SFQVAAADDYPPYFIALNRTCQIRRPIEASEWSWWVQIKERSLGAVECQLRRITTHGFQSSERKRLFSAVCIGRRHRKDIEVDQTKARDDAHKNGNTSPPQLSQRIDNSNDAHDPRHGEENRTGRRRQCPQLSSKH